MTPFGARLRALRAECGMTQKECAGRLQISAAYLSALEHGRRGAPTWYLVQRIITYFNVIWDEAEELERLAQDSDPRITVDTAGLNPRATQLANRLARQIGTLGEGEITALLAILDAQAGTKRPR